MPLVLLAGVGAIVWILTTGGGTFTLFGQGVSARSPGNLPYGLWLLALLWLFVPRRGRPSRAGAIWAALPLRGRGLALGTLLPLAIRFTLPGHLRSGGLRPQPRLGAADLTAAGLCSRPARWRRILTRSMARMARARARPWPPRQGGERRATRLGFAVALAATMIHHIATRDFSRCVRCSGCARPIVLRGWFRECCAGRPRLHGGALDGPWPVWRCSPPVDGVPRTTAPGHRGVPRCAGGRT
jgi:hypothetical protein